MVYRCMALLCLIISNNVITAHPYGYNQQSKGNSVSPGGSSYPSLGIQPSAAPSHSNTKQHNQQYWWQGSQSPFSAGAAQSSGVRPAAGGNGGVSATAFASSSNIVATSTQFRPAASPPAGSFGSAPQGPPVDGLPYAGCAAALKCVAEEFCSIDGTMVNEPVFLSAFEKEYLRVPLMSCLNKDTNQVGFCCRDPLYEDPWPADMPMPGMNKPGMPKPSPQPNPVPAFKPPTPVQPPAPLNPPAYNPPAPINKPAPLSPPAYNPPASFNPPAQYNPPPQPPRPPNHPVRPLNPAAQPPSPPAPVFNPPSVEASATVATASNQIPQLELSYLPPPGTKPVTRPPAAGPAFQLPQQPAAPAYRPPTTTSPPRPAAPTYFPPAPAAPAYPSQPSRPQAPVFQVPAAPAYNPPASSTYRPPASPAFQQPAAPAFQQPAAPAFQQPAAPAFRPPAPAPQPARPPAQPQAPQGPPANTLPFPGCAAALKCVPLEYCSADGTMVNTPVSLTPYEQEYRVPLMSCLNTETNQNGFCCRDPLYNDPWPAGMPMP